MNLVKLKKEKIEVDYEIKKIENIIANNENFEEYILLIENSKQDTPENLANKILDKIDIKKISEETEASINIKDSDVKITATNSENNKNDIKVIKRLEHKFIDMLKIAACTVFALLIWEITPTNTTYAKDDIKVENIEQANKNTDNSKNKSQISRKINDFFMSSINIERGDN